MPASRRWTESRSYSCSPCAASPFQRGLKCPTVCCSSDAKAVVRLQRVCRWWCYCYCCYRYCLSSVTPPDDKTVIEGTPSASTTSMKLEESLLPQGQPLCNSRLAKMDGPAQRLASGSNNQLQARAEPYAVVSSTWIGTCNARVQLAASANRQRDVSGFSLTRTALESPLLSTNARRGETRRNDGLIQDLRRASRNCIAAAKLGEPAICNLSFAFGQSLSLELVHHCSVVFLDLEAFVSAASVTS